MNTYREVSSLIGQWKNDGLSKSDIVVKTANACIGWPYVYGGRGEECTPSSRRSRASSDYPTIISKCQVLSKKKSSCGGCTYYPGGTVLFFDCRGFTYWLMKQVGIKIEGAGATTQYDTDSNWSEKGSIANMPKDRVCCVFRYDNDTKKMEHTLLYDGQGNYIHCSGEVKKVPTSKYKATHYAIPKGLEGGVTPVPTPTGETAVVYADNGKPVKMRAKPSTSCKTYWEIPCGTVVNVLKYGNEWTNISDNAHTGYMMTQFLKFNEDADDGGDGDMDEQPAPAAGQCTVIIPNLPKDVADGIIQLYPGAYITVG